MSFCPEYSFRYNSTLCGCAAGRFLSRSTGGGGGGTISCEAVGPTDFQSSSGGGTADPTFLTTVIPLDSIKRITQSQAVLLAATLVVLSAWLLFCLAVRFGRVDGGRTVWFRIRWWISRLDFAFPVSHWLDDQKVVRKRKTELGGTFSMASWILFIGLLSALLYQIITKRSIEVHRVRPANAPDLLSFVNDMEFNITTISSMSCAHLRGLDTLVLGTPGFIDYRAFPLSTYVTSYCENSSIGPTVSLKCNGCQIPRRNYYVSWQFVDLPNDPAMAVGFQFKLTAKDHGNDKYVSFVSGSVQLGSYGDDKPKTFRGRDLNVIKIHLFPQIYNNFRNLKLIQPLFYDFIPGSSFTEVSNLQASLQRSGDGLVNTTLDVSYISDYIVEIDKENVAGPVSFLADAGGLYAISIAIFLYFLLQCETRIKKLRNEDTIMRDIRSQRRAQRHWAKLRKYVMYTWGPSNMNVQYGSQKQNGSSMTDCLCGIKSMHKRKHLPRNDSTHIDMTFSCPIEMGMAPEATVSEEAKSASGDSENKNGEILHSED